ncbi:hypothetical protein [Sediminibacillus albus]|uniref:DUF4878 domain-containing protein n=1 Tax=Sediminibacillus albus TaxID=407036 RepID=A0A1G8YHK2_9BACI|nr:hypothetical protein [Sediminibacillus albus]SDK02157.1 hypothetical protein SAMN05216243_1617 [Sediminibacillus albus]
MRRGINPVIILALPVFIIVIIGVFVFFSPGHQAKKAVHAFYSFEQEGMYAESYALFHSLMKEKFEKGDYLQDRAHVFMNHFGVESFSYSLGRTDKIKNWKMSKDAEPLEVVYKITVTQVFKGTYGNFSLVQDVYAAKDDGKWTILWNYRK